MGLNYSKFRNYGGKTSLYKEMKAATENVENKRKIHSLNVFTK